ncbi:MAG: hypothetical protein WBX27_08965 [Specibacter sp.]
MANHPSTTRTDLPYLRRRIKQGRESAAPSTPLTVTAPQASAQPAVGLSLARPASSGLSLARPSAEPQAPAAARRGEATANRAAAQPATPPAGLVLGGAPPASSMGPRAQKLAEQRELAKNHDHEVTLLFPAPGIRDIYELNPQEPVLRLTPLESAVGTLVVSGSTAMAWESVRRVVGGADVAGHTAGTSVMTGGNRPLAGYDGKNALLTLRHVRELRRAIFINRGNQPMGVQIFSGASVTLPPASGGTQTLLLAHRIGNVLELRAEPVPQDWSDAQIWQEFDFTMTNKAPTAAYRR